MVAMDEVDVVLWACNVDIIIGIVVAHLFGWDGAASSLVVVSQCLIAFTVFSVMTIRASQETPFRPGETKTLAEEFNAYGYPSAFLPALRLIKSSCAVLLIAGLVWSPGLEIGAGGIFMMMQGAVGSHIKVGDPWRKIIPSFTLGSMCATLLWASSRGCAEVASDDDPDDVSSLLATSAARWWLFTSFSLAFVAMVAKVYGIKDTVYWSCNVILVTTAMNLGVVGLTAEASGLVVFCQCLVAFSVLRAVTVHAKQKTRFRTDEASKFEEEFTVYGYPRWFFLTVCMMLSMCALLLVIGIVWTPAAIAGAGGIAAVMPGAVGSHIKMNDPWQRSVPPFILACMCVCILAAYAMGWTEVSEGAYPPSVFATRSGREAAFVAMLGLFTVTIFQMATSNERRRKRKGSAVRGVRSASNEPLLIVN
eukprot:TRINITY_DN18544_c0_g1_i1.p1 TRINITY_DN18544_c0_g1~~TRINITY_DN18544_c0_g1_i1.p1  ORF type:complete len:421 (+),score=47.64 TRINITY_DN18544_c0_g1_i1:73-1335(+)